MTNRERVRRSITHGHLFDEDDAMIDIQIKSTQYQDNAPIEYVLGYLNHLEIDVTINFLIHQYRSLRTFGDVLIGDGG